MDPYYSAEKLDTKKEQTNEKQRYQIFGIGRLGAWDG
jgi:hypothetical protein